jgi:two-component system OmpR family sensor kinase
MDAGRLSVTMESLDLAPLGEVLATEFGPRAGTSGHPLEVELPDAAPALGDEERVLQIGRILVENALVHTPPGTVVRLSVSADAHGARLVVADDGPGIAPDAQPHVFERFYRLDGTLASGSGLGLAIAGELATLMGGRLELDSRPRETRFTLTLPVDPAAVSDRSRQPALA